MDDHHDESHRDSFGNLLKAGDDVVGDKRAAATVRLDQIARKYATYEDFLDSQVNEMDMFYLEDRGIARTIKELGFHGNSEKITRTQFSERKADLTVIRKIEEFKSGAKYLYTDRDAFLLELARREDANLSGRLLTVIYVRDRNPKGQEISSYVDYAQRLRDDDFASIFAGRDRLVPKVTDLSHYNWDTNVSHSTNSPNFDVIFHGRGGIKLKCKKDRRLVHLDPNRKITDTNVEDTSRTLVRSRSYAQVVLFDHYIRFWANEENYTPSQEKIREGVIPEQGSGSDIDLFDKVTAAIYEEDLLEIARNALGGALHQEHTGEWAPADVLVNSSLDGQKISDTINELKEKSLETSVLGTMRDLYEAHKHDVSFGILGNFTFVQMIEQLGKLLPEREKEKTDAEVAKIADGTANAMVKIPDQDLPLVSSNVDQLVEGYEALDGGTSYGEPYGGKHVANPLDEFSPKPEKSSLQVPQPNKGPLDSASHNDIIKRLYPQKSQDMKQVPSVVKKSSSSLGGGKGKSSEEKLSSAPKTQTEYFRQLEARIQQVFQKNDAAKQAAALSPYPNVVDVDRIKPSDNRKQLS
ncbi:hypothetical protein RvY_00694 [Ramazzottius varieornatus]|uniref:Cilia- and flagella-associated protein 299 n=1 Tax=Ramazzottius varieornatus TaxID=947166 RepID=A0A1D1UP15_RAMVA|nr:hypothetical protein RvY_00694 [Ramazzottius varieornatus]